MNIRTTIILLVAAFTVAFVSCNSSTNEGKQKQTEVSNRKAKVKVQYVVESDSLLKALRKTAHKAAQITTRVLGTRLHAALRKKGAEYAVNFCSTEAMRLTDSVSNALGLTIRRLAKKYRNPKNETLGLDSLIFKHYILRWLSRQHLKEIILPDNHGHPVYYNPIKVQHLCLTCHGEPGKTMDANLAEKIKEQYPHDEATGFKEGQLRGMWSITFPQYILKKN